MAKIVRDDRSACAERVLQEAFNRSLPEQVGRYARARVHEVIGDVFFAQASAECRDMFVTGHYYGSITLAQAVAEGLGKFMAERNGMRAPGDFKQNVRDLYRRKLISRDVAHALFSIHGKDRDCFHHLNKNIEQERSKLEERAEACLQALFAVESEIFAFEYAEGGTVIVKYPKYWERNSDGAIRAFVRFEQ